MSQEQDDIALFQGIKAGNQQDFTQFFNRYYESLYFSILKHVDPDNAKDFVQKAFIKLWERREEFESFANCRNFLFKVAKNASIDFLRRNNRITPTELNDPIDEATMEQENIQEDLLNQMHTLIEKLPKQCKKVVKLQLKDLSTAEIAAEMNITVSAVTTQRSNAVKYLRNQLNRPGNL